MKDLLNLSHDAVDTDNEETDPSFDLDLSIRCDKEHLIESFCEDWVTSLSWDDCASLGLFISFQLTKVLQKRERDAAELAGMMVGKSEKTVREWRA